MNSKIKLWSSPIARETYAKVTSVVKFSVLNAYTKRVIVTILIAFSNISINAGTLIFDVPKKYPFKILDKAIKIIAGQVTFIAFIVLISFTPCSPIIGARKKTKTPIKIAHIILNMATELTVLVKLLLSPFSL